MNILKSKLDEILDIEPNIGFNSSEPSIDDIITWYYLANIDDKERVKSLVANYKTDLFQQLHESKK
jgi:hypothetical protein